MTHPLHTQKSLDQLTWNEVRAIHANLGLKATATTRSRRDYQRRIVEAQPQPVAEEVATATTPTMTCATCPFARYLDGDRYVCTISDTASGVKRGHWEATVYCEEQLAKQEEVAEVEAIAPTATEEVKAPAAVTVIWHTLWTGVCLGYNEPRPFKVFPNAVDKRITGIAVQINSCWLGLNRATKHHKAIQADLEGFTNFKARLDAIRNELAALHEQSLIAPTPEMVGRQQELYATQNAIHATWKKWQKSSAPAPMNEVVAVVPPTSSIPTPTFNHPFRYRHDIFQGQHSVSSAIYRLCECDKCKSPKLTEAAAG
jgi:hypothetical protein